MGMIGLATWQVGFLGGFLAEADQLFVHFLAGRGDDFFDAGGMDAAILHQPFQRHAGDFPADGVEAADDDYAGRVVDDHIDAGGFFEAADVAALAADHAAFHVVAGNGDRADGVVGGLLGGVTLDRLQDDLAALFLGLFLGLLGDSGDHRAGFEFALVFDSLEEHFLGLLGGHVGQLQEAVSLLAQDLAELLFLVGGGLCRAGPTLLRGSSRCFSLTESVSSLRSSVSSRLVRR